jgi:uncharacterized membrane protein
MNSTQPRTSTEQQADISKQSNLAKIQPPENKPLTRGQRLADAMASKVGSWGFLIGQSTVLAGWVGCNLMPGLPHWDESPFILLNLVFSFASAYTAPVVLMSQNRQSEEDREAANHNYQVTLQAAQKLELLHEKLDADYAEKLNELTTLIKQQQPTASEAKVVFVPTQAMNEIERESHKLATLSFIDALPKETFFVNSNKNLNEIEVKHNR